MEGLVLLIFFAIWIGIAWLFYMWGASIAAKKGRSRAMGWWAVFFGIFAIVVLYLLPDQSGYSQYIPPTSQAPAPKNVSEKLARLADLKEKGALTDEEFEKAKADALAHR